MSDQITKEQLNKLPYGDFKSKFEELGIGDAYKHGAKKAIYVQQILDLTNVKSEDENLSTEEAEVIVGEIKALESLDNKTVELTELEKGVLEIVEAEKNGHWTKESMLKRTKVYFNVFLQDRASVRGKIALQKNKVLTVAYNKIYNESLSV